MEFSLGFGWGALAVAALWSAKTFPQIDELDGDAFHETRQGVVGRLWDRLLRRAFRAAGKRDDRP